MHATLDAPGTVCVFDSNRCSTSASGRGGFDEHHRWPESLGGPGDQPLLALCPLHHRRQHSLIRYMVECDEASIQPAWDVLRHFAAGERDAAVYAVDQWRAAGSPTIPGWPCPAARA